MGKTRKRKRVPKKERQNLHLWAEGIRETLLTPHIDPYIEALRKNWREERNYVTKVCREYHARISWRVEDHEEPDKLPPFDLEALIPTEKLSEEEEAARSARVDVLNKRIRRWLKYRARSLRKKGRLTVDPRKDPWAVLLAQLSGVRSPPKARQAYQQFMHEDYTSKIQPIVETQWAASSGDGSNVKTAKEPNAPFRARVAREVFAALPESEQQRYATNAKTEAASTRAAYDTALKEPPSAIETVGAFLAPILQGITERTGMHVCAILGGPVPKYGGDLRTIHVSYGRNKTASASHFPVWAKERFNSVVDLMKEYLHTAFDADDMKKAALPTDLDGAKYTIPQDDDGDPGSDSDSDSSDSSDSSASDSETEAPARKKRKANADKARKSKEKGVAKKGNQTTAVKRKAADGKRPVKTAPAKKAKISTPSKTKEAEPPATPRRSGRLQNTTTPSGATPGGTSAKSPAHATHGDDTGSDSDSEFGDSENSDPETELESDEGVKKKRKSKSKDSGDDRVAKKAKLSGAGGARPLAKVDKRKVAKSKARPTPKNAAPKNPVSAPPPTSTPAAPAFPDSVPPPTSTPAAPGPSTLSPVSTPAADSAPPPTSTPAVPGPSTLSSVSTPAADSAPPPTSTPAVPGASALRPTPTPAAPAIPGPAPPPTSTPTAPGASALRPAPTPAAPAIPGPALPPTSTPAVSGASVPRPAPGTIASAQPPASAPPARPPTSTPAASAQSSQWPGRLASEAVVETLPSFPDGAPKWLKDAVGNLAAVPLGGSFKAVLKAVIRVEEAHGFDTDAKGTLPTAGRPDVLHDWVKGGGEANRRNWWDGLQPEWRKHGVDGHWEIGGEYGDDWGGLHCPGVNGVLNLAASLYFWGRQAEEARAKEGEEWFAANRKLWVRIPRGGGIPPNVRGLEVPKVVKPYDLLLRSTANSKENISDEYQSTFMQEWLRTFQGRPLKVGRQVLEVYLQGLGGKVEVYLLEVRGFGGRGREQVKRKARFRKSLKPESNGRRRGVFKMRRPNEPQRTTAILLRHKRKGKNDREDMDLEALAQVYWRACLGSKMV
ncbi:hypothetical protein B0H13DRAFT_1883804 [Mycena leptocephala]|nr:hypothetical protein B0H13DRAFT_1883804 [Mycena leptocephala]